MVNEDYFELDGKPLAVVGTTYMSSEVQRLYFEYPNVYVWNRELGQIHGAGLNMVRTGWWTGWDKFCNENGQPYERTMRTLEAYLMTARKNGLPIQFNFFAFLPDVLGGVNPYLDPAAVRRQTTLISSVVTRFHDVPWLAWDFINEPSISQHLWTMRPNGDWIELQKWNEWLNKRYPDKAALAAAWNVPAASVQGTVSLPEDIEFTPRGGYVGRNSLKVYDYFYSGRKCFANWVKTMREAVRPPDRSNWSRSARMKAESRTVFRPRYWGQRRLHHQPLLVAERLRRVGFVAGQATGQNHADPGNRPAARIESGRNRHAASRKPKRLCWNAKSPHHLSKARERLSGCGTRTRT